MLGGLLALAVVVGVLCGHGAIDWSDVFSDAESVSSIIVFQGRIPRIILAIVVGAALGASGAAFQAIMRNPLADPFILGTSGGAALGGAIALSLGIGAIAIGGTVVSVLPLAAFAGSLVALVVVYALATRKGRFSPVDVLLVGVVFNFFASAVVMFLKTLVTAEKAHDILESKVRPEDVFAFHMYLIKHGRSVCKAQRPQCERCVLAVDCPSQPAFERSARRKRKTRRRTA